MESKGADTSARAARVYAALDAACALRRVRDSTAGRSDVELLEGATALLDEGRERLQRGDARGALQRFEESRAFGQAILDRKWAMAVEGTAVGSLGVAYRSLGQYEKAIEHLTVALAISREIGDRQNEGSHLGRLGTVYNNLGQYEKAIEHLTVALAISREIGDRQGEGTHLFDLGEACRNLGQYEKAIEHHTMALDIISREIGDRQGEWKALGSLGSAYLSLGQYEKASEQYTVALAISREIGDRQGEGSHLGNLGSAYLRLGQYEKGIEHLTMALEISREIGDRLGEGRHLCNLGRAYPDLGQYEKAIEHLTMALEISREIGDRQNEGKALGCLGTVYNNQVLGQYEKAIEHHTLALAISRETGVRHGEGSELCGLGNAYLRLGQYEKGIEHYTKALEISRKFLDRQGEVTSLNNLGNAYLFQTHGATLPIDGFTCRNRLGQYEKALEHLAAAAAVSDALWAGLRTDHDRITFGDTAAFTLTPRRLQLVHARLAQPEAALEVAERARSRAFELLLAQQRVQRGADAAAAPPPTLPGAVDVAALRGLAGRQRVALVVFSQVADTALFAWVVRGDAPVAFHELAVPARGGASPLTQLVEQTRQTIGVRARQGSAARSAAVSSTPGALREPSVDQKAIEAERGDGQTTAPDESYIRAALARCYELLIAPLGLSDGEPLLIIPDRDLFALPFAALLDSDGKHLIERHSLRTAPSAGTLIELEQRAADRGAPPPRPPALIVGDPDFSGWTPASGQQRLPQLEGARKEAKAVDDCIDDSHDVSTLRSRRATKAEVVKQMAESDVIHLATHGAPDGLFFAGESEAEATLRMAEVQGLDLRARLVVLSACDSFKAPKGEGGSELSTDGVVGITRAFVAAGALTLVSSLWKVSDDATLELMRRFYTAWVAGGDVAAALREAMVGMIEEGRWSVREWGAFVVYGLAGDGDGVAAATSDAGLSTAGGEDELFLLEVDDAELARFAFFTSEVRERGPTAQMGPAPAQMGPAPGPFTKDDWEKVLYAFDHRDEAGRCFKVRLGKYFLCGPGPSREYWIQYLLDERKPFLLLHVHFRGPSVGSADCTPIFSHVTSANAGFSCADNVPGRFNQFMQRSIRDAKDKLTLTGGHPRIDSVVSNSHEMGDYSEVDGRLPISGAQIKLGTRRPLVISGPQGQLCSEWGKMFDFTNILRLCGTGADVSVVNLAAPEVLGEIATRVLLRVDLLRVQDLDERHRLFEQLQALEHNCYVGGSDFKLLSFEARYAPREIGWDYENHVDANGSHAYPSWPPWRPADSDRKHLYAAIASAAELRRVLMHIEGVRQQWERPLPDGYFRRWGKKVQQKGAKPMEDEDSFRGGPTGPTRGGNRSGESEVRTPEKVQLKCSLTGPPTVPLGEESFELKVWLLAATAELTDLLKQELAFEESKQLAGKLAAVAANEATFRVDVTVEGCEVEPPCCLVKWTDQTLYPSAFDVAVPADFSEPAFQCRVLVRSQANPNVSLDLNKSLKRSAPGAASPASVIATSASLEMKVDGVRAIVEQMAIGEHSCPRIPWLQPEKTAGGGLARRVGRAFLPSRWITDAYRLYFVCPVTLKLAPTNGGQGYLVRLPKSWWKTHGWWVRGTLVALAAASTTAGRVIGLPLELGDTMGRVLEQIAALEAQTIRDYIDAIDDTAASAVGSSGEALAEARPATAADFRALKALVEKADPQLLHCGLTLAVADDGMVEWVAPDVLARFKAQGRAALQYETAGAAASSSTTA